jgi:hypothetical protein
VLTCGVRRSAGDNTGDAGGHGHGGGRLSRVLGGDEGGVGGDHHLAVWHLAARVVGVGHQRAALLQVIGGAPAVEQEVKVMLTTVFFFWCSKYNSSKQQRKTNEKIGRLPSCRLDTCDGTRFL